jgi:glucose/arabinose dehydrogenase
MSLHLAGCERCALVALAGIALILTAIGSTSATDSDPAPFDFSLDLVAEGFEQPVHIVDPNDGSGRLVVVEQIGRLRIIQHGQILPAPFLDISDRVGCCGERGLLSAAFHPDYETNGRVFLNYTDVNGDTVVARFRVSQDGPNLLDVSTGETVLTVDQPAANHNGGLLLFGPRDGYLYIGLGDGGGGNGQNGQDLNTLLGKILRIDINAKDGDRLYAIPPDNPFVSELGARPEIWVYGLRNPWRFSFDRATGDLWIGDVGSAIYEEANVQSGTSGGGENFGWDAMEGDTCRADVGCEGFVAPVSGFDRSEGCVVTGGYVYRGTAIPDLQGVYLFADYCGGAVWGLVQTASGDWERVGPIETGRRISSFGEDAAGEVFVVDLGGAVYRLGPAARAD